MTADSAPLPSYLPPPPDPLDLTPELRLEADMNNPLLLGFVGYDQSGSVVLRGRRDGEGFRAVLMNFVLEDALAQPYYRIRRGSGGFQRDHPFQLLAPDGSLVGSLRYGLKGASLEIPGHPPLLAAQASLAWHGYTVEQASVTLATISFVGHPLDLEGAELHLHFEPAGAVTPVRRWVVALVAWATLVSPPWRKMTTR
ncbi:MAG: hypothetical protein L3K18_04990 [Thermoplasmata archaeon]|nr:hypothetical protein [Thermoplasmata archaeon]